MENNHFEKQVRERLADLKIHPSPENWSAIEGRIRKKKVNKRFAWFFLAGLLLLSGFGYLLIQQKAEPVRMITQLPPGKTQHQPTTDKGNINIMVPIQKDSTVNGPNENIPVPEAGTKNNPSAGLLASGSKVQPGRTVQQHIKKPNDLAEPASSKSPKLEQTVTTREPAKVIIMPGHEILRKENSPDVQPETLLEVVKFVPQFLHWEKFKIEGKEDFIENIDKDPVEAMKIRIRDSSANLRANHKTEKQSGEKTAQSKRKWEWGFTLSGGKAISGNGISLALLESNKYQDLSSYVGNASSSYNISRPPTINISKPKSSVGFNAGLLLKKSISSHVSLMGGLNYSYYSNTISIYTQNSFSSSALSAMSDQYRNNFHFIDLPIMFDFQLNRNKKIPLHISAGASISRLLISDAIELKDGYYVRDGSFLNKTHAGIGAGFSATFFKKVSVGPFARYGLGKIANEGVYGNKHWNYVGLKLDYLFVK